MDKVTDQIRDEKRLNLLIELIGQINSNLDLDTVLQNILTAAKSISNSEASSALLFDDIKNELILSFPSGQVGDTITGKRFPADEGIAGWVATNAEPQIVNDLSSDQRFRGGFDPNGFKTRNMICVPLKNQFQEVIGVLKAINKKGDSGYDESEIPIFQTLANQAAIAITNAQLHEERKTLMSEIHHRVKNNMAVVSGMMQMQALTEEDEFLRSKLLDNVARISSIATVHEEFYKSESFSRLNFTENLEMIVKNTVETLNPKTNIITRFDCDLVVMNINQSIPCSLVVNEVLISLIKHRLNSQSKADIYFKLREEKTTGMINLTISNNGHRQTKKSLNSQGDLIGSELINVLIQQLEADFKFEPGEHINKYTLTFKKSDKTGSENYSM